MKKEESPYYVESHLKIQKNTFKASPELDQYIQNIRTAHETVCNSEYQIINHKSVALNAGIECGKYLLICKKKVGHGNWSKFFNEYFWQTMCQKTASNYMRLAENVNTLDRTQVQSLRSAYIALGILKVGENKHKATEERSVWNPGNTIANSKHIADWKDTEDKEEESKSGAVDPIITPEPKQEETPEPKEDSTPKDVSVSMGNAPEPRSNTPVTSSWSEEGETDEPESEESNICDAVQYIREWMDETEKCSPTMIQILSDFTGDLAKWIKHQKTNEAEVSTAE